MEDLVLQLSSKLPPLEQTLLLLDQQFSMKKTSDSQLLSLKELSRSMVTRWMMTN
jgi:hypothetical protein